MINQVSINEKGEFIFTFKDKEQLIALLKTLHFNQLYEQVRDEAIEEFIDKLESEQKGN